MISDQGNYKRAELILFAKNRLRNVAQQELTKGSDQSFVKVISAATKLFPIKPKDIGATEQSLEQWKRGCNLPHSILRKPALLHIIRLCNQDLDREIELKDAVQRL